MILLITGASHVGKTALAQRLLEKYQYPYLSIDHLKMGLIRSGNTDLTPMSDDKELNAYLWPIVREMIKTAGLGVAMANAAEELKAVADYVTGHCNEAGFAQAVEKFVLNK